jgi:hypothetical protein
MKSRKWIGTVLITLAVVAVLFTAGYGLYRFGYARGMTAASSVEGFMFHDFESMPFLGGHMGELPRGRFNAPGFDDMPEGFQHRADHYGQLVSPYTFGRGLGHQGIPFGRSLLPWSLFSPLGIIVKIIFFSLGVWVVYKFVSLFSGGRSWQLSFSADDHPDEEAGAKPGGRAKKT